MRVIIIICPATKYNIEEYTHVNVQQYPIPLEAG
jgi:hypothetical protein